jgi:hypothetical protein
MLHELDVELERRGLRFCRYADDCNVYVKSEKAACRVMKSIICFIEVDLKLKVNQEKSFVGRPWDVKFLGFSFYFTKGECRVRFHPKAVNRFKVKLKELTGRSKGVSLDSRLSSLRWLLWVGLIILVLLI